MAVITIVVATVIAAVLTVPALVILALIAGFVGALVEHGVNVWFHSAFAARMLGLMVFGIIILAGAAGAFTVNV